MDVVVKSAPAEAGPATGQKPRWQKVIPLPRKFEGTKTDHVVWVGRGIIQKWADGIKHIEGYDWSTIDRADFRFPTIHEYGQVELKEYCVMSRIPGCGHGFVHRTPITFFVHDTADGLRRIGAFTKKAHIQNAEGKTFVAFPTVQHESGAAILHDFVQNVQDGKTHKQHLTDIARNLEHVQAAFVVDRDRDRGRPRGRPRPARMGHHASHHCHCECCESCASCCKKK